MEMNQLTGSIILLKPEEFDERPGPFCMSFGFDLKPLIASINTVGLINKPLISRNVNGSLEIITGYRRIMALKALNWNAIPCVELTGSGLSNMDFLLINLHENICTRGFNNVEKSMIINRLLSYITISEIYEHYMNFLNISGRKEIDLLVKVEDLPEELKDFVAKNLISVKTLELLIDMKIYDIMAISRHIKELHLNFNQQLLFLEYIKDISIIEGVDINTILAGDIFFELLIDNAQNIPQRAKRIMDRLKVRRFPILTKNEKTFAKLVSDVRLPANTKVKHTPFFEGPDYTFEISFKNGKELKKTIDELAQTKGLEDIKDPWAAE
jgi:hypothetical protein